MSFNFGELKKRRNNFVMVISGDSEMCKLPYIKVVTEDSVYMDNPETFIKETIEEYFNKHDRNVYRFYTTDGYKTDKVISDILDSMNQDVYIITTHWDLHGKSAAYQCTEDLFTQAVFYDRREAVLFWDGENKLTRNMIWIASQTRTDCNVFDYKKGVWYTKSEIENIQKEVDKEQMPYYRRI